MSQALALFRPLLAAVALLALPAAADDAARLVRPGPQLTVDGIPPFVRAAASELREPPVLRFLDWHPLRAEMLVLARAGASQQLHRLDGPGQRPQPLTHGRDAVAAARWEPARGDYLVFSRDQGGDEAFRLYRLRPGVDGDAPLALSPAEERVSEFQFLPEGRGLVYLLEQLDRHAEGEARGGARQARSRLVWVDPTDPSRSRVIGDVRGARYTGLRVSPAGAVLATMTRDGRSQTMRFMLDGAAPRPIGEARREEAPAGEDEDPVWSRQAVQGEFRHLVRMDALSGHRENLLAGMAADIEALAVPPRPDDERPMALVSNEDGISVLRLYRPGSVPRTPAGLSLPPGVIRNPKWHPRLPLLAFEHSSSEYPGRIQVWAQDSATLSAWSGLEPVAGAAPLATTVLRWKSFDGLAISGLHIAPPARFKGPRPVYISIHGGPSSQSRPGWLSGTLRALVEQQGVHLILPNVRGSEGFGRRFLGLDNGRQREDAVRDISALLDLVATREDMDAARVIVVGGSYGGYMSLAVAARESKRIAASICRVGIANFVSFLENTESYRRDNRRAEYGDERDPSMREFLQRISPLSRAAEVRKPLFIVHGRNDPRVPYGEAVQMAQAVRAVGTPVWFLTADDEGHSFSKADNRDYLHQATLEFVRRVIAGEALQ